MRQFAIEDISAYSSSVSLACTGGQVGDSKHCAAEAAVLEANDAEISLDLSECKALAAGCRNATVNGEPTCMAGAALLGDEVERGQM